MLFLMHMFLIWIPLIKSGDRKVKPTKHLSGLTIDTGTVDSPGEAKPQDVHEKFREANQLQRSANKS